MGMVKTLTTVIMRMMIHQRGQAWLTRGTGGYIEDVVKMTLLRWEHRVFGVLWWCMSRHMLCEVPTNLIFQTLTPTNHLPCSCHPNKQDALPSCSHSPFHCQHSPLGAQSERTIASLSFGKGFEKVFGHAGPSTTGRGLERSVEWQICLGWHMHGCQNGKLKK